MSAGDQVIDSKTLLFFEKQPAAYRYRQGFSGYGEHARAGR